MPSRPEKEDAEGIVRLHFPYATSVKELDSGQHTVNFKTVSRSPTLNLLQQGESGKTTKLHKQQRKRMLSEFSNNELDALIVRTEGSAASIVDDLKKSFVDIANLTADGVAKRLSKMPGWSRTHTESANVWARVAEHKKQRKQ